MPKKEKRPLIIKLFNFISGKTTSLDFDHLIKKARRRTDLMLFDDDFNENALKVLIQSINEEAQLHPFGKMMIQEKLISQLVNRLWAAHWFRKYPEILNLEVKPIYLITGLQRTGTTKMQRLLSSLADSRALYSWEALYPAPMGDENEKEKRLRLTKRNERAVKWMSPTFHSIHPIYHDQPEEDVLLLDQHFMSSSSEAIMHVPSYVDWINQQDVSEAYAYEKKLLKLLQWQRDGKYWVLKSPHHLEYLDIIQRIFPTTKIIWTHRDIESCIPSFMSMLFYGRLLFSNQVDMEQIKVHWLPKIKQMLHQAIDFRQKNKEIITDVNYLEFMGNEKGTIHQIFPNDDIQEIDQLLQSSRSQSFKSTHHYQLEEWGLTSSILKHLFSDYQQIYEQLQTEKMTHE